ncbi:hypothetical protein [Effusibacillus lacus]|uniref:Uncharacterized protein n=1 Tax=Effusibacillus lacus TaxID=1348429 RepID=A0A292YKC3_9BACL|nr:hypothetical protein [Effusibacillus lacus]TCS75469.1 hypothetical protein EDD64_10724 [Effusibacillus lacus]GAX88935.1 hypothetical protein EFBL_0549 [Effusibacillus lacus]
MLSRILAVLIIITLFVPVTVFKIHRTKAVFSAYAEEGVTSSLELDHTSVEDDQEGTGFDRILRPKFEVPLPSPDRVRDLRKFPYPYGAMFAFASDIDDTTPREFAIYHRFLNTREMTPAGPGLGLDVGDTMWVYMGNDSRHKVDVNGETVDAVITLNKLTDPNAFNKPELLKHYFDAGWIDGMHTFGDFSRKNREDVVFSRELAIAAWENLNKVGIRPHYWINHGNEGNRQNFGAHNPLNFLRYQAGDDPKSPYYHTDLTIKNGVRFVWNSVGEDKFGQDNPIFPIQLRDGQKIWGFHRYTHEVIKGQIEWAWSPDDGDIGKYLTKERLDQLVAKNQYCIYAQHFGGSNTPFPFYWYSDVEALRRLADYHYKGKILVARTSRLLNYSVAQQFVEYKMTKKNGKTIIHVKSIQDPLFGRQEITIDQVRGLTFYVDDPSKAVIVMNRKPVPKKEIQVNPQDETGRPSIGIKWFEPDTKDYSQTAP